ncbi:MAG TPA: energy transducer TonB [Pyrinomonadaceae bacterium]|nr:energy transducer TonB [Pyrinomonadaceae bacterium]
MKLIFSTVAILLLSLSVTAQSGRRAREIKTPVLVPPPEANEPAQKPAPQNDLPQVTAEKNEDYRCSDDGSLARILDSDAINERVLTSKQVDERVVITSKPAPGYTKEARRLGIQGFVNLKMLLSGDGKISRIRVVKGLRAGLTENAIRAACKMKFKPAMKDSQPVSQWVTAEYVFRLADSSIFGP